MPAIPKVIPADMLAWFNSPGGKWFKKEISSDDTPDAAMLEGFDAGPLRRVRQVVGYLASKDASLLFGTDTPSAPTYGNLPGLNGYLEAQQLKKAGLSLETDFPGRHHQQCAKVQDRFPGRNHRAGQNRESRPAEEISAGKC